MQQQLPYLQHSKYEPNSIQILAITRQSQLYSLFFNSISVCWPWELAELTIWLINKIIDIS